MNILLGNNPIQMPFCLSTKWEIGKVWNETVFICTSNTAIKDNEFDLVKGDQIIDDFLKIGDLMYKEFFDSYTNNLLNSVLLNTGINSPTPIGEVAEKFASDENFYFFQNRERKEELIKLLYSFLTKYGFRSEAPLDIWHSAYFTLLTSELATEGKNGEIIEAWYLANTLFTLYLWLIKPKELMKTYPTDYPWQKYSKAMHIETEYDKNITELRVKYSVHDTETLIYLLLIEMLYGNKCKRIKSCARCGNSFIADGERQKYCDPACKNRANVAKNYTKNKGSNNAKKSE